MFGCTPWSAYWYVSGAGGSPGPNLLDRLPGSPDGRSGRRYLVPVDYEDVKIRPLPEPWRSVSDVERPGLVAELHSELVEGHPLYGQPVVPIAKCDGCDDVVFAVKADPGWFALVHLTWSRRPDRLPWPRTREVALPLQDSLEGH